MWSSTETTKARINRERPAGSALNDGVCISIAATGNQCVTHRPPGQLLNLESATWGGAALAVPEPVRPRFPGEE